jgi:hypothetical protein
MNKSTSAMKLRGNSQDRATAVFLHSGLLAGVLLRSLSFRTDFRNPNAATYLLPVISPIRLALKELRRALNAKLHT